jgi:hypothetical protein
MSAMKAFSAGDALAQALEQQPPLRRRDDARHDVEGDQPLRSRFLAVDGEGDPDAAEQEVRLGALLGDSPGRHAAEPALEPAVVAAHPAVAVAHFIEGGGHEWGSRPLR